MRNQFRRQQIASEINTVKYATVEQLAVQFLVSVKPSGGICHGWKIGAAWSGFMAGRVRCKAMMSACFSRKGVMSIPKRKIPWLRKRYR
jgi:hypothetical protein